MVQSSMRTALVLPRSFELSCVAGGIFESFNIYQNRTGSLADPTSVAGEVDTASVVAVIAGIEKWDNTAISLFPNLKCIIRFGVGMDNVDLEFAKQRGIAVFSTPLAPAKAVAEYTIALALSMLRNIPSASHALAAGSWVSTQGRSLSDKRVGIVGLGNVGRAAARLFRAFGCAVSAYDPFAPASSDEENYVRILELEELISTSDVISLHVPLSSQTRNMIRLPELMLMKKDAVLINTSRGAIVNEVDLHIALTQGHLGGVALDVFEEEPYHGSLMGLDRTLLTPHIASNTFEAKSLMSREAAIILGEFLAELVQTNTPTPEEVNK